MRATCSTKRGDLRVNKKAVNPKYPNPLFSKNETLKGIQHQHSASTSLISKLEDIDQRMANFETEHTKYMQKIVVLENKINQLGTKRE